jgi:hypothetical protein
MSYGRWTTAQRLYLVPIEQQYVTSTEILQHVSSYKYGEQAQLCTTLNAILWTQTPTPTPPPGCHVGQVQYGERSAT